MLSMCICVCIWFGCMSVYGCVCISMFVYVTYTTIESSNWKGPARSSSPVPYVFIVCVFWYLCIGHVFVYGAYVFHFGVCMYIFVYNMYMYVFMFGVGTSMHVWCICIWGYVYV